MRQEEEGGSMKYTICPFCGALKYLKKGCNDRCSNSDCITHIVTIRDDEVIFSHVEVMAAKILEVE